MFGQGGKMFIERHWHLECFFLQMDNCLVIRQEKCDIDNAPTAGKFATAVQKFCWRLNTKFN